MLHSVIMAGGSGTRFWPLSRQSVPKQFLTLEGERSLIQQAFDRCQPWIPPERTWVVTAARLAETTRQHLPAVPLTQILQEPAPRNTAPCVGLAALCLQEVDPDAMMLVMSADHVINDLRLFEEDVARAQDLVLGDPERLVLFGVPPTYAATGFGYIETGLPLEEVAFSVASFREKPDFDTATRYVQSRTFLWNCGIFVWRADRILRSLQEFEPELHAGLEQLRPHVGQTSWNEALADVFPQLKSISIDYAVLERDEKIAVLPARFPWDDVGGWEAMTRLMPPDENNNTIIGLTSLVETSDCIVRSTSDHLVCLLGMKNCIVVQTPEATLVAQRGDDESIRRLIAALERQNLQAFL